MNDESRWLVGLARQIMPVYMRHPGARAAMVTGSAARGEADRYSDLDVVVYYEDVPSLDELDSDREENGGEGKARRTVASDGSRVAELHYVRGVRCDISHLRIAAWEEKMAAVLEQHDAGSPIQDSLAGLLRALPLHGVDLIRGWQARAAHYPDELAAAMVQLHLRFYPRWLLEQMAAGRGDRVWLQELLLEQEKKLLGILCGLNRIYHHGEFKRLDRLIARMAIVPPELEERLLRVLRAEPLEAVGQVERLIQETLELVDRHLPQVDTWQARQPSRFGVELTAWQMDPV
jgi:hypothetical protein